MLVLYTDFGLDGPYVGQMRLAAASVAPGLPVIDLMHDAPAFRPVEAGYLLAALAERLPPGAVVAGVVDPGVGSARRPVVAEADGRLFVGPDNGLFAPIVRRAAAPRAWAIDWRPPDLSASFHGRDLFVPVAARLASGQAVERSDIPPASLDRPDWPDDLPAIVHVDSYGNAATGLRADGLSPGSVLTAGGRALRSARTFSDVPAGTAFWYRNANGLAEISVNQGSASEALGLSVGTSISVAAG